MPIRRKLEYGKVACDGDNNVASDATEQADTETLQRQVPLFGVGKLRKVLPAVWPPGFSWFDEILLTKVSLSLAQRQCAVRSALTCALRHLIHGQERKSRDAFLARPRVRSRYRHRACLRRTRPRADTAQIPGETDPHRGALQRRRHARHSGAPDRAEAERRLETARGGGKPIRRGWDARRFRRRQGRPGRLHPAPRIARLRGGRGDTRESAVTTRARISRASRRSDTAPPSST